MVHIQELYGRFTATAGKLVLINPYVCLFRPAFKSNNTGKFVNTNDHYNMKTIFDKTTREELISRINLLNDNSTPQWAK